MEGFDVRGEDGEVGKVSDFYFDAPEWIIRYAIVHTGDWLTGRLVLISPNSFKKPEWQEKTFPVSLTRKEIENNPTIDEELPVSRQKERSMIEYYSWPFYWGAATQRPVTAPGGPAAAPMRQIPVYEDQLREDQKEEGRDRDEGNDPHLRSLNEVEGYDIKATDGEIGHVEDLIVDTDNWAIRYLVVDTRDWIPGSKKVLIAPEWINWIGYANQNIAVDLDKDTIEKAPSYDPDAPIDRKYETKLYDYYKRPKYWEIDQ
jgi:sporulation protein YlmC with PRC-barrel domain